MSVAGRGNGVPETERLARVVLSRGSEPGDLTTASLVNQLGAQEALRQLQAPKPGSGLPARLQAVDPVADLEQASRMGIRFVVPGDDEWPGSMNDLAYPEVQGMGGVPMGLWVKGPARLDQLSESVAVVGARSSTVYGSEVARALAGVVARAGLPVLSGVAIGIDTAAHEGALGVGGPTVGVLACGLDRPYPSRNYSLFTELSTRHCVVSELPHGSSPTRPRFLARNRLIAALARATVLVEAAIRSGALNTANWADQLSRQVFGVPGPVTSAASQGVHQRIREGGAALVTHGLDVLEHLGHAGEHLLEMPRGPEHPRDRLRSLDQRVVESLPVGQALVVTEVAQQTGIHVRDVDAALRRLRSYGFVALTDTGWQVLPQP